MTAIAHSSARTLDCAKPAPGLGRWLQLRLRHPSNRRINRRALGCALVFALGLVVSAHAAFAQAKAVKPRVPPGRDAGGVAIAIVGPGIEYTRADIAVRLARDGEGEIIGWDFVDHDRRPFGGCEGERGGGGEGERRPQGCDSGIAAGIVLDAPASRLIVVRVSPGHLPSLAMAMQMLDQTPARIVLFALETGDSAANTSDRFTAAFLQDAASRFPRLLLISSHRPVLTPPSELSAVPAANLIRVIDADNPSTGGGDIAVPTGSPVRVTSNNAAVIAASRVASMAARLLTLEPDLDAETVSRRITSLAAQGPSDRAPRSRFGVIADPDRHFQPK